MVEARSGIWWLADKPDKKAPGTLLRADDNWQLDIIGSLPVDTPQSDTLALVPPTIIHGTCLGQSYTLRHAYLRSSRGSLRRPLPSDEDELAAQARNTQQWEGYSLLEGVFSREETLYDRCIFELTGLSAWWPVSGLRSKSDDRDEFGYSTPEPTFANCDEGLTVAVRSSTSRSHGVRSKKIVERVVIEVWQPKGITLEYLEERVIFPLQSLLSISTHREVETYNLQIKVLDDSVGDEDPRDWVMVSVDPGIGGPEAEAHPVRYLESFTAKDLDPSVVIPKWLRIATVAKVPVAVAGVQRHAGTLQSQVVEHVNAAETLHRTIEEEGREYPFTHKVWEALRSVTTLNRNERVRVRNAVKLTEIQLKDRLIELAAGLGEGFCEWFFEGQLADWAAVAAVVRNALSHGYKTSHLVEQDLGALVGVVRFTKAVVALRLLVECGVPTGDPLIELVRRDPEYRHLIGQKIANWRELKGIVDG